MAKKKTAAEELITIEGLKLAAQKNNANGGNARKRQSLIAMLEQKTQSLTKQDVGRWRAAHQQAVNVENPRRGSLYDIYADTLIDLHLSGCISQRMGKTLLKSFIIKDANDKENEEAKKIFESQWFYDFMLHALDSRYWGHSLIQLGDIITDTNGVMRFSEVELVPRKNVVPEFGVLLREWGDDPKNGIDYRTGRLSEWCVEVGDKHDLGLLLKCAPHALSKKNMIAYWDVFGEIFGMPMRIGKTTSQNPSDRRQIEAMLADMGAAAWGLFPDGTDIEIKESTRGDAYNVYLQRVNLANSEISKGVLNQTMTIDSGSSLSQSQTHLEVFENVCAADHKLIQYIVNDRLIPKMVKHGFPLEGCTFEWDNAATYTPEQQRELERVLLQYYDIDPEYFKSKYKIDILGKREDTSGFFRVGGDKDGKGKDGKAPQEPKTKKEEQRNYYRLMNRAVAELYAPDIITLATKPDTPRIPFKHEVFEEAVEWLHKEGRYTADMLADPHAHRLIEETYNALDGAIGSSITQEMPEEMTYALRNNAFIFSGFKTHRTLSEVGLELTDEEGNLKPYAKFLEDVKRIDSKYNDTYLYAEYNHAVHTTQMAVKWQDFVRDGDDYNLQYRTAGDERVREAHIALDGVTLPPSDKFWDRYLPPNGWNCRCTVVQVLREDFPLSDSEEAIKRGDENTQSIKQQMFRFNPGKTLEVFPPKHPYLPKGCGDCQLRLNLAWGKGQEQCSACNCTRRYLLKFSRTNALNRLNEEHRPPVKIRGEQVQYRRLYYGKNDRENVIQHCNNPQEILIALRLEEFLPTMQPRGEEPLKEKKNTPKKIDKGVKCYTKYEFEAEVLERGQFVKRAFILKCEVIKTKKSAKCEYPYCIQPKE